MSRQDTIKKYKQAASNSEKEAERLEKLSQDYLSQGKRMAAADAAQQAQQLREAAGAAYAACSALRCRGLLQLRTDTYSFAPPSDTGGAAPSQDTENNSYKMG